MTSEKVKEIICVVVVVAFILLLSKGSAVSEKSAEEVSAASFAAMKLDENSDVKKCDNSKIKKEFGFTHNDFEAVVYYASDSVMQVRELLVIKLKDKSQAKDLTQQLESRVQDKAALFKGYAPEESALLEKYVLKNEGGFILFSVCDSPNEVVSAFKKAL